MYQRGDYVGATQLYEDVLAGDPELAVAYFYLGNSYDNLYQPDLRGDPDNDYWLELAIDNYKNAVDRETDGALRTQAMQYLSVAYGPDKADDLALAMPLLEQVIERDRASASNLRALGRLYHDAGEFENAVEPDNTEGFYIIVPYYWRKAFRDTSLSDEQELEIVRPGITEVNKALTLNADYMEALVYKNILKRMQANHTADTDQRARPIAEANGLRDRAEVLVGRR